MLIEPRLPRASAFCMAGGKFSVCSELLDRLDRLRLTDVSAANPERELLRTDALAMPLYLRATAGR